MKSSSSSSSKSSSPSSASSSAGSLITSVPCSCKTSSSVPPVSSSSSSNGCPETGNPHDPHNKLGPKNSTGTKACEADKKATNATGMIGPNNFAITQAPYKVYSCDQVIVAEGKTFIKPDDYGKRKDGIFTISAYMINYFDTKDPKSLKTQILLDDVTELPDLIHGAPQCISFIDNKNVKKIDLCMKSEKKIIQIKQAYDDFMKCRMGDNLSEVSREDLFITFKKACQGREASKPNLTAENKYMQIMYSFLPPPTQAPPQPPNGVNPAFGFLVPGEEIKNNDKSIHTEGEQRK